MTSFQEKFGPEASPNADRRYVRVVKEDAHYIYVKPVAGAGIENPSDAQVIGGALAFSRTNGDRTVDIQFQDDTRLQVRNPQEKADLLEALERRRARNAAFAEQNEATVFFTYVSPEPLLGS